MVAMVLPGNCMSCENDQVRPFPHALVSVGCVSPIPVKPQQSQPTSPYKKPNPPTATTPFKPRSPLPVVTPRAPDVTMKSTHEGETELQVGTLLYYSGKCRDLPPRDAHPGGSLPWYSCRNIGTLVYFSGKCRDLLPRDATLGRSLP